MPKAAERLLEAYYNQSLHDYRTIVAVVRRIGGLSAADEAYLGRHTTPTDAATIVRQAHPRHPIRPAVPGQAH
jgi:hypothetical protein